MLVRVVYDEFQTGKVQDFALEALIRQNRILGFFRSDGYVQLGRDPVRGAGGSHVGIDRRRAAKAA